MSFAASHDSTHAAVSDSPLSSPWLCSKQKLLSREM